MAGVGGLRDSGGPVSYRQEDTQEAVKPSSLSRRSSARLYPQDSTLSGELTKGDRGKRRRIGDRTLTYTVAEGPGEIRKSNCPSSDVAAANCKNKHASASRCIRTV